MNEIRVNHPENEAVTIPVYTVLQANDIIEAENWDVETSDLVDDIDRIEEAEHCEILCDMTFDGLMMNFDAVEPHVLREWTENLYGQTLAIYAVEDDGYYAVLAQR